MSEDIRVPKGQDFGIRIFSTLTESFLNYSYNKDKKAFVAAMEGDALRMATKAGAFRFVFGDGTKAVEFHFHTILSSGGGTAPAACSGFQR